MSRRDIKEPRFSIVVPIYNREDNISDVIDSVVKQSYSKWELLLIDDGSTDATGVICKKYADVDERIYYIEKENGGVSTARNKGINLASGDYIIFLDSDNSLTERSLEVLRTGFNTCGDADFIVYGYNESPTKAWIPEGDGSEMVIDRSAIRKKYLPTHFNIYEQDTHFIKNFVWNKCFSSKFLFKNNIKFDENRKTWEDGIFVVECLDKAEKFLILPEVIYNAYCELNVEHLSSKFYKKQIFQYISDEVYYRNTFGKEFDFTTDHYIKSNFNMINILFNRVTNVFGIEAKPIISTTIQNEIVQFWAEKYIPQTINEKKLRKFIINGNVDKIYGLYHTSLIKRVVKHVVGFWK